LLLAATLALPAAADDADAIRERLQQWVIDFNEGRAEAACDLFSRDLLAILPREPESGYAERCDASPAPSPTRTSPSTIVSSIRDIVVESSLATALLFWSLRITPGDTIVREVGLHVFRKEDDGQWRIVRFLSYDEEG
jgi:ketosteroid isomerase-like protein